MCIIMLQTYWFITTHLSSPIHLTSPTTFLIYPPPLTYPLSLNSPPPHKQTTSLTLPPTIIHPSRLIYPPISPHSPIHIRSFTISPHPPISAHLLIQIFVHRHTSLTNDLIMAPSLGTYRNYCDVWN